VLKLSRAPASAKAEPDASVVCYLSSDRAWFGVGAPGVGAPVAGSVDVFGVRLEPCDPAGSVAGRGGEPGFWSSSRL
jgi:hypothetical protein